MAKDHPPRWQKSVSGEITTARPPGANLPNSPSSGAQQSRDDVLEAVADRGQREQQGERVDSQQGAEERFHGCDVARGVHLPWGAATPSAHCLLTEVHAAAAIRRLLLLLLLLLLGILVAVATGRLDSRPALLETIRVAEQAIDPRLACSNFCS